MKWIWQLTLTAVHRVQVSSVAAVEGDDDGDDEGGKKA